MVLNHGEGLRAAQPSHKVNSLSPANNCERNVGCVAPLGYTDGKDPVENFRYWKVPTGSYLFALVGT